MPAHEAERSSSVEGILSPRSSQRIQSLWAAGITPMEDGDLSPTHSPRHMTAVSSQQNLEVGKNPDVLHYGDEIRLWACSEYALAAFCDTDRDMKAGGYVGVYFKGKKRKSRTGQQPLSCVPPIGPQADGVMFESRFRCVDPRGLRTEGDPVRLGDEILLVDADGHVWNTSTAGVVGYLTMRLRGERGELRVRFVRDLSAVNFKGTVSNASEKMAWHSEGENEFDRSGGDSPEYPNHHQHDQQNVFHSIGGSSASLNQNHNDSTPTTTFAMDARAPPASPRSERRKGRLRGSSAKSQTNLRELDRPIVRFGDALWLVSCPQHDETHPGAGRNMRKEHVLTNFKRDTSSTLGGYLTVDPRGYALQFVVSHAPPTIDKLMVASASHYNLPWGTVIPFDVDPQTKKKPTFALALSSGATAELDDLGKHVKNHRLKSRWGGLLDDDSGSSHSQHGGGENQTNNYPPGVIISKFWLRLANNSSQTMGSVLVEVAAVFSSAPLVPPQQQPPEHSQQQQRTAPHPVVETVQMEMDPTSDMVARAAVAFAAFMALGSPAARAVVLVAAADAWWDHACPPGCARVVTAGTALAAAAVVPALGWTLCALAWGAAIVLASKRDFLKTTPTTTKKVPKKNLTELRPQKLCSTTMTQSQDRVKGELVLVEWSQDATLDDRFSPFVRPSSDPRFLVTPPMPDFGDRSQATASPQITEKHEPVLPVAMTARTAPATIAHPPKGHRPQKTEHVEAAELRSILELKALVKEYAYAPRWLEDGELLRFVRARKNIDERAELYREAMGWRTRTSRSQDDDVYAASVREDPLLGSFGCLERAWCEKTQPPPSWWAFLSSHLPFELYGTDPSGLPVTYLGLGRMDLVGVAREVGIDRLEQKIVMQNDMFLDIARERRIANGEASSNLRALHGGVFIIDCDGMGRRHLTEVRIFKRVSAALKILHPERQRKTFVVRAPRIFSMIWRLIKPMLDARIISKINILGPNDSLKPLFDELGHDNVPAILGGNFDLANPPTNSLLPQGAFDTFRRHHH